MSSSAIMPIDDKPIEKNLAALMARSQALVVRDQTTFVEARNIQKDLDSYMKNVGFEFDPGIAKAKDALDHLKNQKEKWIAPARAQKESVRDRADAWAAEEKRKAAAEQERVNAENRANAARQAEEARIAVELRAETERKQREQQAEIDRKEREAEVERQREAGEIGKREAAKLKKQADEQAERDRQAAAADAARQKELAKQQEVQAVANVQDVRVAPSVPKVAGVKNQTYYTAEVNGLGIIKEILATTDTERKAFLSQFIMVDEQAVRRYARDQKDSKKVEAELPDVRAWSKG